MRKKSNQEIVEAFRQNDWETIKDLYAEIVKSISKYILDNSGDFVDVKDIVQECFLVIGEKIRNNELKLTSSFYTYAYSICRNLWLKELRCRKIAGELVNELNEQEQTYELDSPERMLQELPYLLYFKYFDKLSKECKKILQLFNEQLTTLEIAKKLKLKSAAEARKKKYTCKMRLVNWIRNDQHYKEARNNGYFK